jgi:hypothetical protein
LQGAYPNWKDLQGRTAFNLAMNSQHLQPSTARPTSDIFSGSQMFATPGATTDLSQLLLNPNDEKNGSFQDGNSCCFL